MKNQIKFILLVIVVILLGNRTYGQVNFINATVKDSLIYKGLLYKKHQKYDSTLVVLEDLLRNYPLKKTEYNQLRFERVNALERQGEDALALDSLYVIQKYFEQINNAHYLAKTLIVTSLLYEKHGFKDEAFENLESAKTIINQSKDSSLFPLYHVRLSSCNRVFEERDSAKVHAQKAVFYGELLRDTANLVDAYMLKAFLIDDRKSLAHLLALKKSMYFFRDTENYRGYAGMSSNISSYFIDVNKLDSAYTYSQKAVEICERHDQQSQIHYLYFKHAQVAERVDRTKEALDYYKKYYETEISKIREHGQHKVEEIKEEYQLEKKKNIIKNQQLAIEEHSSRNRQFLFLTIAFFTLFVIILILYLNKRKLTEKISIQQQVLEQSNDSLNELLEKEIVLKRELHHRVKNNLQLIISLLELNPNKVDSRQLANRIHSISAVHTLMYHSDRYNNIPLELYIKELGSYLLTGTLPANTFKFLVNIDQSIFLEIETITPLGLIVNELITNSIKYALSPDQTLDIRIDISKNLEENSYLMIYKDNGPGVDLSTIDSQKSYGSFIIQTMTQQLGGKLHVRNNNGLEYTINFQEQKNQ